MKNQNQYSIIPSKLLAVQFHLFNLLAYFIFFGCGISVGILYGIYGGSLRVTQFSFSSLSPVAPLSPEKENSPSENKLSQPMLEKENPLSGNNLSQPMPEKEDSLSGNNNLSQPMPEKEDSLSGNNNSTPLLPPVPLSPPMPEKENPLSGNNNNNLRVSHFSLSPPTPEKENPLSPPIPEKETPLSGNNNNNLRVSQFSFSAVSPPAPTSPEEENTLPGNNSLPLPEQAAVPNPPAQEIVSPLPEQPIVINPPAQEIVSPLPEQPIILNPPAQELPSPVSEQPTVLNPPAHEVQEQPVIQNLPANELPLPWPEQPTIQKPPDEEEQMKASLPEKDHAQPEVEKEPSENEEEEEGDEDPSRIGLREFLRQPPVMHDMNDKELMWRACLVSKVPKIPVKVVPKVAFLFLVKGPILLAPFWEEFFQGNEGLYSIYVHSDPSFNASDLESSVFHGRRIPSKKVGWGKVNMVEAELRLLANALLDVSNERFVLLSESCIPLFNFATVYSYLMNSTRTFIEVYDQPGPVGRGRYSDKMLPAITLDMWRKGSQWFEVDRDLALDIVSDRVFFPMFKRYCEGPCYADEHYLQTYVHVKCPLKNAGRSLTWVDWSRGGPHPSKYIRTDVTYEFLEKLRFGYTCEYNGQSTHICFLFARKFLPHSLERLVKYAPKIMQFHLHKP